MDSYFGQIGHSFYGGPNGQSFSIKETFPNKVALDADVNNNGFSSSVQIGEYIIISYGNPHAAPIIPTTVNYSSYSSFPSVGASGVFYKDTSTGNVYCWGRASNLEENRYIEINSTGTEYYYNKVTDYYTYDGETYNATLWQKKFENDGIMYNEIVAFETNSPEFIFLTQVQNPGDFDPEINNIVDISTSEITKTFQLSIPNVWDIVRGQVVRSNPGDNNNIQVAINNIPDNESGNESSSIKYIHFTLPNPWGINITHEVLNADENPSFTPTDISNTSIKKWILGLPQSWEITLGGLTVENPDVEPNVFITNINPDEEEDHNSKYIYFSLPKAWNLDLGVDSGSTNPINSATVSMDQREGAFSEDSEDTKYIHIKIPNAWDIVKSSDSEVINPGEDPNVIIDRYETSEIDENEGPIEESNTTKYVHFKLPKAWDFAIGNLVIATPSTSPNVQVNSINNGVTSLDTKYFHFTLPDAWEFDLGDNSGSVDPIESASVTISQDATTKYLHIQIPNAWNIVKSSDSEVINPGENPNVIVNRYEITGEGNQSTDTKYIHFKLPKAWAFELGNVEFITPNTNPSVTLTNSSASGVISQDTKYLHFRLPVAQEFTTDAFTVQMLGPSDSPNAVTRFISGDTIHRYPKVQLSLPRAEKTKYGVALAYLGNTTITQSNQSDWIAIQDLSVGDMYINTTYAAVHKIVTKTDSQVTTQYLGSMQLTIPIISTQVINPYSSDGNPVAPRVYTNSTGPTASWTVNVETVKSPKISLSQDSGIIAPFSSGEISRSSSSEGVTFTFKIPRGSRINTNLSSNISELTSTALNGDVNIDENGYLRQYDGTNWQLKATLHGESFNIKNNVSIEITEADLTGRTGSNIYQKMGEYISDPNNGFPAGYYTGLKPNEMLNIVYIESDIRTSYWLYKSWESASGVWTGAKLTGDVSNTIVSNTWQQLTDDDNKAYSITRINELLGGVTISDVNGTTIKRLNERISAIETQINNAWGTLPIN